MTAGVIYVLSNPHMPGVVKIGMTSRSAELRAQELSASTGVPGKFFVEFELETEDCERAEQEIHTFLWESRVSADREFFRLSVESAISAVTSVCGGSARTAERPVIVRCPRQECSGEINVMSLPAYCVNGHLIRQDDPDLPPPVALVRCSHCGETATATYGRGICVRGHVVMYERASRPQNQTPSDAPSEARRKWWQLW